MLQDEARPPLGGFLPACALSGRGRASAVAARRRARPTLAALALAVLALAATPARADLCEAAALRAADAYGVPRAVMRAVLRVETGWGRGAARRGWPWSANADGRGFRFDSLEEAMAFATGPVARAAGNVDLGCFQISRRWHGEAFSGPREMLDPDRNALYAARLLRGHHERLGDWTRAVGAYHSMTEVHASRYRGRFQEELAALDDAPPPAEPGPLLAAAPLGAEPEPRRRAGPILTRLAGLGPAEIAPNRIAPAAADRLAPHLAPEPPLTAHPPLERVAPLEARPTLVAAAPLEGRARPLFEAGGVEAGGGAAAGGSLVPASSGARPLFGRGWGG